MASYCNLVSFNLTLLSMTDKLNIIFIQCQLTFDTDSEIYNNAGDLQCKHIDGA
jgi:hypothetical protein